MPNVNAVTVNAITANLKTIFKTIKFQFEDGSKNTIAEKITWIQLEQGDTRVENNFGEGPMYAEQDYLLTAQRKIDDKDDHRTKGTEISWELKENITVDALNVGDLASSKLVSLREMETDVNEYNSAEGLIVTANLTVWFRDLRT